MRATPACRSRRACPSLAQSEQDSLDSDELHELHVDDVYMPVGPATLRRRLEDAGCADIDVVTNEYAVRFRAKKADAPFTV
jgi:hypothetical protein